MVALDCLKDLFRTNFRVLMIAAGSAVWRLAGHKYFAAIFLPHLYGLASPEIRPLLRYLLVIFDNPANFELNYRLRDLLIWRSFLQQIFSHLWLFLFILLWRVNGIFVYNLRIVFLFFINNSLIKFVNFQLLDLLF